MKSDYRICRARGCESGHPKRILLRALKEIDSLATGAHDLRPIALLDLHREITFPAAYELVRRFRLHTFVRSISPSRPRT